MKKQLVKNIIVLGITTLLMGALIGLVHFVTAPIIKRNQDAKAVAVSKELFSNVENAYRLADIPEEYRKSDAQELTKEEIDQLDDYLFVFDNDKKFLGVVALGRANGYGGEIELAVAISKSDKIIGISEIAFTETTGIGDRALTDYKDKVKDVDLNYTLDVVSGATVTSNALKTILSNVSTKYQADKSLFNKVLNLGSPLTEAFGGDVTKTKDSSFAPNEILLEKYNVTGANTGVTYVGAKEHSFDPGYSPVSGIIKIEFFISSDGTILGYEILEYGHSKGSWQPKVIAYLDSFVQTKTADILATMTANKGLYAGASETAANAVDPILVALEAEVNK